jgi:hypothetical protein
MIACQKELERFIVKGVTLFWRMRFSPGTIERKNVVAIRFIALRGSLSPKQVVCLSSGAMYLVQDYLSSKGELKGRMITGLQTKKYLA